MNDAAIAKTILDQLGGNKFIAMTGAKNLACGTRMLCFRFPGRKLNYCEVQLQADDTYTVRFAKIVKYSMTKMQEFDGIYCDQLQTLFTRTTGLDTRL